MSYRKKSIQWSKIYRTTNGRLINASVDASYNIIEKVVPKTFDKVDGIEAFGVTPVSVLIE
ncbi:MAG: hypothetical protein ACTSQO_14640 [Candidatus Helarchaeota archaeon]